MVSINAVSKRVRALDTPIPQVGVAHANTLNNYFNKRQIGCCAACKRPVLPGTEPGFDFDHTAESTKSKGGLFGECGGVSGLVNNIVKAATLALVRVLLDAEMALCQLLCKNCHARKTHGYEASTTEF